MDICSYYVENIQNMSNSSALWMQRMRSSFSDFNKKLFYGNSYDFGDFDSCLTTTDNEFGVIGKYCLIKYHSNDAIKVPPSLSVHNLEWKNIDEQFGGAVCIPSICNNDVINILTNQLFNGTSLSLSTDYEQNDYCQVEKTIKFNYNDYTIISLILLYVIAILGITWNMRHKDENCKGGYLCSFSILGNLRTLFDTKNQSLQYLSFLRTLLYIGLVAYHSFFLRAYYPLSNSEKMLKFIDSPFTKFLSVLPFGILAFIVISSALGTRNLFRMLESKTFNYFTILIDRYARTMFVVAVLIILNIFINNLHIYQAPYYFPNQQSNECRKHWWTTMLLIQNYYHSGVKEMCIPQSWFLSANFQFIALTPLVIYPIWKWKRSFWFIFPALLIASQAIIFNYTVQNENLLKQVNFFAITDDIFSSFYLQTHFLAPAWIIGMLLGVTFHTYKELDINLPTRLTIFTFIIGMFFKLFAWDFVFGPSQFNIFMFTIERLLVSLLTASILFISNYLHGDQKLKKIASLIPIDLVWTVIDRVGLSLYLVHPPVIIGTFIIRKQPMTFDIVPMVITAFGDFLISLLLAIVLYLLVEEPMKKITKVFLSRNIFKLKG